MPIDRPLLVDARGRLLLDAAGQLADPACCCQAVCPETLSVTLSGVVFCDECYSGVFVSNLSFNGTYELTLDFIDPWCGWSGSGPTVVKQFFGAEDCSDDYDAFELECNIGVELIHGEYNVYVKEDTGISDIMFLAVGTSTLLSNGEGTSPMVCGGSISGQRVVASGGTMLIE